MRARRAIAVVTVGFLLPVAATWVRHVWPDAVSSVRARLGWLPAAEVSARAFNWTYLDTLAGRETTRPIPCAGCHARTNGLDQLQWIRLSGRAGLSREAWAAAIPLPSKCGVCHRVPHPAHLPQQSWLETLARMDQIMGLRKAAKLTAEERQDILHYFLTFSATNQPTLGRDPDPRRSPVQFEPAVLGNPRSRDSRDRPLLGHVQVVDLDRDGRPDVLVCDTRKSELTWIHGTNGAWPETVLARLPNPAHTQIVPSRYDGYSDIVVACLGTTLPSDALVGSVVLLVNDGRLRFTPVTLVDGLSRVADVEPGDFNGDGRLDLVVAAYGFITEGSVGWLENQGNQHYRYHQIVKRAGAIHVLPTDLNGDGRLDFVALFAQEHEQISAFLNDGRGGFEEHVLFQAATPTYGSSGIELVDLDGDGDLDILYTNGDNLDLPTIIPRPYHGVQWLENRGHLDFVWHDLFRCYGAYCATAADLNRDGKPDIVVTALFNDWTDPRRASLLWLENDGSQHFTPHAIATQPTQLISASVGDLDQDGWPDIVTSGLYGFPPYDRMARVTLWRNRHPAR